MTDIVKRTIIALAIGLFIGSISGALFRQKHFFKDNEAVAESFYETNRGPRDSNGIPFDDDGFRIERSFNESLALVIGTIGVSASLLFLFLPGILKKGK